MKSSQNGIVMGLSGDDILQDYGKMVKQQPTFLSSAGTSSCTCVGGSTRTCSRGGFPDVNERHLHMEATPQLMIRYIHVDVQHRT